MAELKYMKAVEWDKLPAAFKKNHSQRLAASYDMWLQRKYDGCFGVAYICQSRELCYMASRTGEMYSVSCAHILDDLHAQAVAVDEPADFLVIGEVWAPNTPFPAISGAFRRQSDGPQTQLRFVINDLLPAHWQTDVPYEVRLMNALELVFEADPETVRNLMVAETFRGGEWDGDPLEWAVKWKTEGGFDGAILRNPDAGYTFGLVKNAEIVKVKPVMSLDLQNVGMTVATGEKTGREVFTMTVEYRGVRTEVGSGMPHNRNVLPCHGDIVQIDCMGLTEDGRLREPRFICIRHDKDTPDA